MIASMTPAVRDVDRRDVAIAAVLAALGILLMIGSVDDAEVQASPAAVPLFLLVVAPVLWRRVAPLPALGATFAALLVHVGLFGTLVRCGVVFPLAFLLVFAAGARLELRDALIGLGLALVLILVLALTDGAVDVPAL